MTDVECMHATRCSRSFAWMGCHGMHLFCENSALLSKIDNAMLLLLNQMRYALEVHREDMNVLCTQHGVRRWMNSIISFQLESHANHQEPNVPISKHGILQSAFNFAMDHCILDIATDSGCIQISKWNLKVASQSRPDARKVTLNEDKVTIIQNPVKFSRTWFVLFELLEWGLLCFNESKFVYSALKISICFESSNSEQQCRGPKCLIAWFVTSCEVYCRRSTHCMSESTLLSLIFTLNLNWR